MPSERANATAARMGRWRELALLVACHLESYADGERSEALDLALSSGSDAEGDAIRPDDGSVSARSRLESIASLARQADGAALSRCRTTVEELVRRWEEVDALLRATSQRWRPERMAAVDRNVLRIASIELLASDTSEGVVASEAVRLADLYGAESAPGFVNGVVGSLAARVRGEGGAE